MYRVEALPGSDLSATADISALVPVAPAAADAVYSVRTLKVLIIEDEPRDAMKLERALRHMPWFEAHVIQAGSIAAARFAITSDTFDIIFLDTWMHGETTPHVINEIAKSMAACPVVLMSNVTSPDVAAAALAAGATASLAKSDVKPHALQALIRHGLNPPVQLVSANLAQVLDQECVA
jgi:DNA-binding NtrC family response regulator